MTNSLAAPLTEPERRRFDTAEAVIAAHLRTFIDVGKALYQISADRLYREHYATFEIYCAARWGFSASHGYRLIDASDVAETVADIAPLSAESQARPLLDLDTPLEQQVAVALAYRAAQIETDGKLTAALIKDSVATVQEMKSAGATVDLGNGTMTAAVAAVIVRHHERVQERIDAAVKRRAEQNGTIVLVLKNAAAVVVASDAPNRVTLELAQADAGRLRALLNQEQVTLELSIVRIYPPEDYRHGPTLPGGERQPPSKTSSG